MASFVGWCKHDVFVSYAHVDNIPRLGEEPWVSTFITGLKTELARKLGRPEKLAVWHDVTLGGDRKITPEILEALHGTATLIVILSPGYIQSDWCQREKDTFLGLVEERYGSPTDSRVFLVEIDEVGTDRPDEFGDLIPYKFWTKTRRGRPRRLHLARDIDEYDDVAIDLAYDLSNRLKKLRSQPGILEAIEPSKERTVYLARASGELEYTREDVKRRLKEEGLTVLPDRLYPGDPERYRTRLDEDLERCRYFVQLLDPTPAMKFEGLPHGYAGLEFDRALELLGPDHVMCWYDVNKCPIDKIMDPDRRQFVQKAESKAQLWAAELEPFKSAVIAECQKLETSAPSARVAPLVFVNAHKADNQVVLKLQSALTEERLDFSRPRWEGKPGEIQEELTRKILECDAEIVVFGDITSTWVDQQLSLTRKVRGDKQLGRSLAVYVAPPPEPEDKPDRLSYRFADMRLYDARSGMPPNEFREFVKSLKA